MRRFFTIIFTIVILCSAVGCQLKDHIDAQIDAQMQGDTDTEAKGDVNFYNASSGKILTDLSDRFDFKIEKWKYYFDGESDQDRILFSVTIKNKTEERLDNFVAKIVLNEEASDLIASGITTYYTYEPFDLIPQTTTNGISYSFDLLVEKDEWLSEIGADKNELLDKIRNITLEMKWDGGEETVLIVCDELQMNEQ